MSEKVKDQRFTINQEKIQELMSNKSIKTRCSEYDCIEEIISIMKTIEVLMMISLIQ